MWRPHRRDVLTRAVGTAMAEHLARARRRRRPAPGRARTRSRSRSAPTTPSTSTSPTLADVRRELLRLSGEVARRVRERGWLARTVGIKIRFADFTTVTRVRTLPAWTDVDRRPIYATAAELYDALGLDRPRVRLVGVKCENLREADTRRRAAQLRRPARDAAASSASRAATGRTDCGRRRRPRRGSVPGALGYRDAAAPARRRARDRAAPARDEPAPGSPDM